MVATKRRKTQCPYPTPLRSRKAICDWIDANFKQRFGYEYNNEYHPLCLNVKCLSVNSDFTQLLGLWIKEEGMPDDTALRDALVHYDSVMEADDLFDIAVDRSRHMFPQVDQSADCDDYKYLYDGTPLDVTYSFVGRSGGWLSLTNFEGYNFIGEDHYHFARLVQGGPDGEPAEMPFPVLMKLYKLLVMLAKDITPESVRSHVEWEAAEHIFGDVIL